MRLARFCLAALGVAGCGLGSHDVTVTVTSGTSITDPILGSIKSLEIGASTNGHGAAMPYPLSRPLARTERVTVHATVDQGPLSIGVIAYDGAGTIVAAGSGDVTLDASGPHPLNVGLHPIVDGQLISVTPSTFSLFAGQSVLLVSDTDVFWSVMEGANAGSIDAKGKYTAPTADGTFHVVATAKGFFGHSVTVPLTVVTAGVVQLTGGSGGGGFADGPIGTGHLVAPWGMISDGTSIFFTTQDKMVRKLDIKSGTLSTIAGALDLPAPIDGTGAQAHFGDPRQLALDGNGNLFVADTGSHTIRKVVIATGVVTTYAGDPTMSGSVDGTGAAAHFEGPTGIAWDGARAMYVADSFACAIRKIDLQSGAVTTIAGTPSGMPVVCMHTDGTGGAAHFQYPTNLAYDGNGNLYVADSSVIRKVVVTTGVVTTINVSPGSDLAWDGNGSLWIANNTLSKVDVSTGKSTGVQNPLPNGSGPWYVGMNAVTIAPDGTPYFSDSDSIYSFDETKTALTLVGGSPAYSNGPVYKQTLYGPLVSTRFNWVNGLAIGSDGIGYTRTNDSWASIDFAAGTTAKLPNQITFDCCTAIVSDGKGTLYVTAYDYTIRSVPIGGSTSEGTLIAGMPGNGGFADGAGTAAKFLNPNGLAVDFAHGTAYVADTDNNILRKVVLASGDVSTFAGTAGMQGYVDDIGTAARLQHPRAIVYDGAGLLYFGDDGHIRKVTVPGGLVSTVAGSSPQGSADGPPGTGQFYSPNGLILDATKQNLYVTDQLSNTLRKVVLATGVVSTVAGTLGSSVDRFGALPASLNQPQQIAMTPAGDFLVATPREQSFVQIRLP